MAARSTPVRKAWRSLTWLGVIIALLLVLQTAGAMFWGWGWAPKLALDLEGGTQIILTPTLEDGEEVTEEQLQQSVVIIRNRIDAAGVSESEISTQGGDKIVISIPGTPDQETLDRIQQSAKMEFRAVLVSGAPASAEAGPTDSPSATPTPDATETPDPASTPSVEPTDASDPNWVTPELQAEYDAFTCDQVQSGGASSAPARYAAKPKRSISVAARPSS